MIRSSRRWLLRTAIGGGAAVLAGCSGDPGKMPSSPTGSSSPGRELPNRVGIETIASGFQAPLDVAFVPGADRRYVADQSGIIRVHESDGLRDRPLLDLRDSVEFGGEKGLLGMALHPEFASTGRLFVRYSAPRRPGTPEDYSHTFVLEEFTVGVGGRHADLDSERTILEIPEPQSNHNAGSISFGPDGYLYVGVGDGGGGGDQGTGHVDDWYASVDGGNAQNVTENLLGSILRIDVDAREGVNPYGVPEDNPLVGRDGLDEHWAWGFRNPWRMAFDDGRLFVGDVGESSYEEVDLVEPGGNYGWNVKEGFSCFDANDCPDRTPDDVRGGERFRDPILAYPHSGADVSGISVIGGQVYRGSAVAGLDGAYVFGDLDADGYLFVAVPPGDGRRWPTHVLPVVDDGSRLRRVLSFGRDPEGEVYVLATGEDGGGLHRLVEA